VKKEKKKKSGSLLLILQLNRDCGKHGKRVARQLWRRHEILVAKAKRCETMVEVEIWMVKAEMEKEVG